MKRKGPQFLKLRPGDDSWIYQSSLSRYRSSRSVLLMLLHEIAHIGKCCATCRSKFAFFPCRRTIASSSEEPTSNLVIPFEIVFPLHLVAEESNQKEGLRAGGFKNLRILQPGRPFCRQPRMTKLSRTSYRFRAGGMQVVSLRDVCA